MSKNKPLLVLSLLALLVIIATLSIVVSGQGRSVARNDSQVTARADADLEVPSANMPLSSGWKAQPASGAAVSVAWANIRVNSDNTNEAQNEPFVAVDPNNANHIVVGANSWQVGNGHFEAFAYVSFDGGKSWATSQPYINRNASRLNAADSTVAFGADGAVYFAFVAMTPAPGAVAVSRSNDGGLTWASQSWATSFNSAADKPALAASNGGLYVYYQNNGLFSTSSADAGATWGASSLIDSLGRNAYPVVGAAGSVSVFYATDGSIRLARSVGTAYSISTVAKTVALQPRPTQYRASIYPVAGIDSSGNTYVAWADGRNAGHGNDILFVRSTASGWSSPVTLNTDGSSADQLMPSLGVGANGTVTVAWLDNRNDAANVNYDVYAASSADGVHFGANQRVTSVSSNPNNDPRTQGTMIGDYFSLASGNGMTYITWTDTRNNNEDIYLAPVTSAAPAGN